MLSKKVIGYLDDLVKAAEKKILKLNLLLFIIHILNCQSLKKRRIHFWRCRNI